MPKSKRDRLVDLSAPVLLAGAICFSSQLLKADGWQTQSYQSQRSLAKEGDVIAALEASKKSSPVVYADAIRVWKNFKSGKVQPHFTYRSWAHNLILWLREHRQLTFEDQSNVTQVFSIMRQKKIISDDAAIMLSLDTWGFLVHREGMPDLEAKKSQKYSEDVKKQGQET